MRAWNLFANRTEQAAVVQLTVDVRAPSTAVATAAGATTPQLHIKTPHTIVAYDRQQQREQHQSSVNTANESSAARTALDRARQRLAALRHQQQQDEQQEHEDQNQPPSSDTTPMN